MSDLEKSVGLRIYIAGNRKWVIRYSSKHVLCKPKARKTDVLLYKFQETKLVIPSCVPQVYSFLLQLYNESLCKLYDCHTCKFSLHRNRRCSFELWPEYRNCMNIYQALKFK